MTGEVALERQPYPCSVHTPLAGFWFAVLMWRRGFLGEGRGKKNSCHAEFCHALVSHQVIQQSLSLPLASVNWAIVNPN